MPAFEARLRDFEAADTQVVGISCDSIYCHDAWAKSLGGISYPLLADIHREVVKHYGVHWPELNACYRATFVVDKGRCASSSVTAGASCPIPRKSWPR
jgi:alkyl hydroperoxide reductase subunit AhpC